MNQKDRTEFLAAMCALTIKVYANKQQTAQPMRATIGEVLRAKRS